jgi:putative oxidoreductase
MWSDETPKKRTGDRLIERAPPAFSSPSGRLRLNLGVMILTSLTRFRDAGLLFLRIGLGAFFILHGGPKLIGGPKVWLGLGKAMANMGVDVIPMFWGFMASFAECFGGIFVLLGLFFRPAVLLIAFTMTVASVKLAKEMKTREDFINVVSRPMELAVVFYSLLLIGPGKYSIDKN